MGGVNHRPRCVEGYRTNGRFVFAEKGGIDFDRCHMLRRDVDVLEDRVHRTDDLALLAVDTDFGVDIELWRARSRMDAGDRTDLNASSVIGAQARNDVRHFVLALLAIADLRFQISQRERNIKSEI